MLVMVGAEVDEAVEVGIVGVEVGRTGVLVWQALPIAAQHKKHIAALSLATLMDLIIPMAQIHHNLIRCNRQ